MASTVETNFMTFYNSCPTVLIRYDDGTFYVFPFSHTAGSAITQEARYTFATGRFFSNICLSDSCNQSATKLYAFNVNNYTSTSTYFTGTQNDNSGNIPGDKTVTLNNQGALTGYTKLSSGTYANKNTSNYIIIDRPNFNNYHFSVYTKKGEVDFLNDFLGLGTDTRNKFLTMASVNASYGNQRFGVAAASHACSQSNLPQTALANCNAGAVQWCRDDGTRLWGSTASTLITDNNTNSNICRPHVTSGALDDYIYDNCQGKSVIDGAFCKNIRQTNGSTSLKTRLNQRLGEHCRGLGNDINDPLCNDVKTACSAEKAALNDITVPNYKCQTLVNSLNDINKIAMLESTMNIFNNTTGTTLSPTEKSTLSTAFNGDNSAVQSALCSKAANASEASCQTFLSQNYKTLLNNTSSGVTDTKPVLIMYFNDEATSNPSKLFAVPNGMVGHNSLNVTFTKTTSMTTRWYAKLYTYITPSTINDYLFTLNVDDDARLYINNTLIVDAWGMSVGTIRQADAYINLNPANGPYLLYVEFRDTGGTSRVAVQYKLKTENQQTPFPSYDFIVLPANAPVTGTVTGTSVLHSSMTAGRLYMSKFHPYEIIENARRQQSLSYCQANNASGVPRFASDSNCLSDINNRYAIGDNTKDIPYRNMINEYCITNNRFATDTTFCNNNTYSSYILNTSNPNPDLNIALGNYCYNISNNLYTKDANQNDVKTNFCRVVDNQNTNNEKNKSARTMNLSYETTIRNNRLAAMRVAIDTSLSLTGAGKGTVTQDVIDYITTDYPNIQSVFGINQYANNRLIPHMLYAYCESLSGSTIATTGSGSTATKTLTTTSNLCNAIYNTYKTDLNIIASLQRIEDNIYGIQNNAFMGVSSNTELNNKYKRERDSPEKFARYLPYAVNYCAKDNNIVSEECKTYYNTIEGNINAGFAKQYNQGSVSGFANKEEFCNNNEYNDTCDNNDTCNNSNSFILFLLFLFVIILVISLGSVSKCRKPNYYTCSNYELYN